MSNPPDSRVLVGIVTSRSDLGIVAEQGWYRVPFDAKVTTEVRWPPNWFAAFETVEANGEQQQVRMFAHVDAIETATREELFPDSPPGSRGGRIYYKLILGERRTLADPLMPARPRRNPFIQTTLNKLTGATDFNDLFDDSPYEDELWVALRGLRMSAERQWHVKTRERNVALDFALFCEDRGLDVEVDGRAHHSVEANSISDAERDRLLSEKGWAVSRFTTRDIRDRLHYCLERISATVSQYGGVTGASTVRQDGRGLAVQPALFESRFQYDSEEALP